MAKLVRIARDKSAVIFEEDGWFSVVNSGNTLGQSSEDLSSLLASGSWRRPVESDIDNYSSMSVALTNKDANRQMRLPKDMAQALGRESITITEASQIYQEFKVKLDSIGGEKGLQWLSHTSENLPSVTAAGSFEPSDDLIYIATSNQPDTTQIDSLFAITEDNVLLRWLGNRFDATTISPDELDEPTIIEVDAETAKVIADWVEDGELDGFIDIAEIDPVEAALFRAADSEIDWELTEAVTAALFYDNAKRAQNAERQERGPDGKFNGPQHTPSKKFTFARARIPEYYEAVVDPAGRVTDYIENVKGTPVLLAAATDPVPSPEETEPLYMAIVDEVDRTAVLNIVAILKDEDGVETAWIRENGLWVPDQQYLEQIRSGTPPTVVELTDPEIIKDVLRQIDSSDSEEEEEPVAASAFTPERRKKLAQQGYAMPSGAYPIVNEEDLKNAIQAYGRAKPEEKDAVRRHIRKRAKALGRGDLLPETWKEAAVEDLMVYYEEQHRIYDDFGSITAAGVPGVADTPGDWKAVQRLRNYWMFGKGALKIRWGTPGDLTRCHRHLSKYMPGRAWGYCQERHRDIFGIWNPESGGK